MEISSTGIAASQQYNFAKDTADQQQTLKATEQEDNVQKTQEALEPRPVEQTSSDKLGRIDIYA